MAQTSFLTTLKDGVILFLSSAVFGAGTAILVRVGVELIDHSLESYSPRWQLGGP